MATSSALHKAECYGMHFLVNTQKAIFWTGVQPATVGKTIVGQRCRDDTTGVPERDCIRCLGYSETLALNARRDG